MSTKLWAVPFTQPDSITGTINNPKTLTAYNYVGGDPINSSDPSGRCTNDPAGSGGDGTECPGSNACVEGAIGGVLSGIGLIASIVGIVGSGGAITFWSTAGLYASDVGLGMSIGLVIRDCF